MRRTAGRSRSYSLTASATLPTAVDLLNLRGGQDGKSNAGSDVSEMTVRSMDRARQEARAIMDGDETLLRCQFPSFKYVSQVFPRNVTASSFLPDFEHASVPVEHRWSAPVAHRSDTYVSKDSFNLLN